MQWKYARAGLDSGCIVEEGAQIGCVDLVAVSETAGTFVVSRFVHQNGRSERCNRKTWLERDFLIKVTASFVTTEQESESSNCGRC
jgi:hypothetical protein